MAQTSYQVILTPTQGHRLIMQVGTHKYTAKTKTVTMTIGFRKLLAAFVAPSKPYATTSVRHTPYVSASYFTEMASRKVVVTRTTAAALSGLTFSYAFYGF